MKDNYGILRLSNRTLDLSDGQANKYDTRTLRDFILKKKPCKIDFSGNEWSFEKIYSVLSSEKVFGHFYLETIWLHNNNIFAGKIADTLKFLILTCPNLVECSIFSTDINYTSMTQDEKKEILECVGESGITKFHCLEVVSFGIQDDIFLDSLHERLSNNDLHKKEAKEINEVLKQKTRLPPELCKIVTTFFPASAVIEKFNESDYSPESVDSFHKNFST